MTVQLCLVDTQIRRQSPKAMLRGKRVAAYKLIVFCALEVLSN